MEGPFKGHLVHPPCIDQGHLQLEQVTQSPVQPDLECFQGWGIYLLSGRSVHLEVASGLWDASHQVPWTCIYSGSSDDLKLNLILRRLGIHFLSPCLEIQGLQRYEKGNYQWKMRQKRCWVPQPSPCQLSPDPLSLNQPICQRIFSFPF